MFVRDVKHGARSLRGQPALTAVAVLSLALGLAAATGATSVLDAVGFRPPAVTAPETLVRVQMSQRHERSVSVSWADYQSLQGRVQSLASLTAFGLKGGGLSGPEAPPEVVMLTVTSAEYFSTLGVSPAHGRAYGPTDIAPGTTPPIVISDRLWHRRFGGAPDVVGRTVMLNNSVAVVLGVLPPEFTGLVPLAPDIWVPYDVWRAGMPGARAASPRDERWLTVVGRLPAQAADEGLQRAEAELKVIAASLAGAYPETNADQTVQVLPELTVRRNGLVTVAMLLWMVVGLVLLVACANVAGLLLGRGEQRRREMAIRVALGAGRGQLVRQLLTESLLLAGLGCGGGLLLGYWLVRSLPGLLPTLAFPLGLYFPFDLRVIAITISAAIGTVLVFGLGPAFTAARSGIASAARTPVGDRATRGWSARHVLVVAQIAVSFVLLLSGAVFVRAFRHAQHVDPGFQVRPMLLVTMAPAVVGYNGARARAFFRELVTRVAAQPGVLQVGLARRIPLDANGGGAVRQVTPPDGRAQPDGARLEIRYTSVSANYFSMMGTHVRAGRAFTDDDTEASQKVVVINETMARRYWPTGAVGRSVRVDGVGECVVVGVVQDGKYRSLYEDPDAYMFFPLEQVPSGELTLMVRTDVDPAAGAQALREVLRTLDPRMPFMQVLTLEEHARFGSYETRVASTVLGYLGGVGLVLSLTGLYGVVTFVVARRTREIGIRMALGARPRDVFRNVLIRSLTLAGVGAGAGAVLGWLGTRGLARSMYGINPAEPIMFIATGLLLILVSAGASVWPARRAMRVNPVTALRSE